MTTMANETQTEHQIFVLIAILIIIIALIILIAFYINVWIPFANRRNYIKMEISRTTGEKRKYWKRQLKYLYIDHIPLIGKLILKKILK